MMLLHAHSEHAEGVWLGLLDEVLWHGFLDTLKLIPFLFLTYLLMEFIEHKAEDKVRGFMARAGKFGPLVGSALGAVPQCGFSVAAANLYTGRVITLGTVVAVFLSTSDEMLPILMAGDIPPSSIFIILGYKSVIAAMVGIVCDLIMRFVRKAPREINIDELCDNDNCHCERGILYSALHHTVTVSLFIFIITLIINCIVYFIGEQALGNAINSVPAFISHAICALVGLIPNCAASVVLSSLYTDGIISAGAMISGLFPGAGVGLLVLFRVNRRRGENFAILGVLIAVGIIFGLLFDALPFISI